MPSKKLALFDIDGTILPLGTATFSLVKDLTSNNLMDETYLKKILSLREDYYTLKKLDYEKFATEVFLNFATGIKGKSESKVISCSDNFLRGHVKENIYGYAKKIIPILLKTYDVYFITANTQFYASFFAKYLKATDYKSTKLEVKNGIFTGNVSEYLTKAKHKDNAIKDLIKSYLYNGSLAFGDADSDIIMLRSVEIPFCINPRDKLREEAIKKGWIITDPKKAWRLIAEKLKFAQNTF